MREKLFRVLMQWLGCLPTFPSEPYCLKKLWNIRSFESLEQHNCLHKEKLGLPCKNLTWMPFIGLPINLQLLRFMGWENLKVMAKSIECVTL